MTRRTGNSEASHSEFEKRLVRYAMAGSAVLGVPAVSHASTIFSGSVNQQITSGNSPFALSLDGSAIDFTISASGTEVQVYPQNGATFLAPSDGSNPYALAAGAEIYANAVTTTTGKLSAYVTYPEHLYVGNWSHTGSPAYLGVVFQISGATHVGWAQIATSVTTTMASAELIDYAYNSVAYDGTNAVASSIAAGDTGAPEPSSLALYALGAAGIAALRRRRKSAA
jgi:hypothetical protein